MLLSAVNIFLRAVQLLQVLANTTWWHLKAPLHQFTHYFIFTKVNNKIIATVLFNRGITSCYTHRHQFNKKYSASKCKFIVKTNHIFIHLYNFKFKLLKTLAKFHCMLKKIQVTRNTTMYLQHSTILLRKSIPSAFYIKWIPKKSVSTSMRSSIWGNFFYWKLQANF